MCKNSHSVLPFFLNHETQKSELNLSTSLWLEANATHIIPKPPNELHRHFI